MSDVKLSRDEVNALRYAIDGLERFERISKERSQHLKQWVATLDVSGEIAAREERLRTGGES